MDRNVKTRFVFLIIFIQLSLSLFSQDRWQQGFVLLNNLDSLLYEIDVLRLEDNATYCVCRDRNKEEIIFPANKIHGILLSSGRKFESKAFKMDSDSITLLVEFVVEGLINVYDFMENGERIYLLDGDGKPIIVARFETKKAEISDASAKDVEVRSYRYIGMLKAFTADAPELHPRINTMSLNEKNLISISRDYHNLKCRTGEKCIVYEKDGIYSMSLLAVSAGIEFRSIHLTNLEDGTVIEFGNSGAYNFGGVLTLPLYREGIRLDMEAEINYSTSHNLAEFNETDGDDFLIHTLDYQYRSIRALPGVRLIVRPENISWAAFAGPAFSLSQNEYMQNVQDTYRNGEFIKSYDFNDLAYVHALGGIRLYVGMLFPVTKKNMLQVKLEYQYLTSKGKFPNLYTISARDYRATEQSLGIKTAIYF